MTPTSPIKEIAGALLDNDRFLVASHANPDGDALGSTAAMGHLLAGLSKRFWLYNASGVSRAFDWLDFPRPVLTSLPRETPRWIITLDCGDPARTGPELRPLLESLPSVNIDHHLGNPMAATLNWVDTSRSSTGEMVAELARELDVAVTPAMAEAVYAALATDTGFFSYGNTTPATLRSAAELLEAGLDTGRVNQLLLNQWSRNRLQLMGEILKDVEFYADGRIGLIRIPTSLMEKTGADDQDTDGLVNYVRRVKGVEIAISLRQKGSELVKFSLRSSGMTDVQAVAASFGGGGHKNASGGQIQGSMQEAVSALVPAATEALLPPDSTDNVREGVA